ncbi:MAG: CBS domain-containing protein [Gammaproteobacteria bacterium]|tara:strand:- start:153 stop:551 length:399 start_codon:yes stop_codon:yes gene_type:complete
MPETIESLLLNQRYWEIFAVARDSSIEEACKIMDKNRIGALLVYCSISNDPQDLEGIVTERDIIELIAKKGRGSLDKEVKEIMSKNIISVTPQCSKMDALDLMMENQIRHLAVMDSEKLVGVLSMRDLIKQL